MFTQECFIRKDNKELRDKLIVLGHRVFDFRGYERSDAIVILDSKYCTDYRRKYDHPFLRVRLDSVRFSSQYIDCGTNEEMFLALAALRDDSDINQWFVDGDFWVLCNYGEFHYIQINPEDIMQHIDWKDKFHKATPEEIVEHFTRKEN